MPVAPSSSASSMVASALLISEGPTSTWRLKSTVPESHDVKVFGTVN